MASEEREIRFPPEALPYSHIGIDLDDGSLYPDQQGKFSVLVDFIRQGAENLAYRKVELEALELSGVDYVVLPFDPATVRVTFERVQPQPLHGDRTALLEFLKGVEDGKIHSGLHRSHFGVGR